MANASNSTTTTNLSDDDVGAINRLRDLHTRLKKELARVIIGQNDVIERLAICMFARGHALLMGVPGLAKTLLVSKLAETMSLNFSRIQFTPDLMPMDITGTDILQDGADGRREFQFIRGPVFANIVLADEINRAPPKTQAAMLEAMQEQKVTVVGKTFKLESPFFVLATQNPVEQEGTYPLPEAQLDRFMFNIVVKYPNAAEELRILKQTTGGEEPQLSVSLTARQILALQEVVRKVPVAEHVFVYARDLVRATRPNEADAPKYVKEYLNWGAGPRAGQFLIQGGKAMAAMDGRFSVSLDDIRRIAVPVLRHRIATNFQAQADGLTSESIVERLVREIPEPEIPKLVK